MNRDYLRALERQKLELDDEIANALLRYRAGDPFIIDLKDRLSKVSQEIERLRCKSQEEQVSRPPEIPARFLSIM